jgi:hypothetical protein
MYPEVVQHELEEALVHLQALVSELRDGKIDGNGQPEVCVQLSHVLDHLCRAWNRKDIDPETALSQQEFNRLSNTVPNFMAERVIGEFAFL